MQDADGYSDMDMSSIMLSMQLTILDDSYKELTKVAAIVDGHVL